MKYEKKPGLFADSIFHPLSFILHTSSFLILFYSAPLSAGRAEPESPVDQAHGLYFQGALEKAVDLYATVPEDNSRYAEALLNRALVLNQLGRTDEAAAELVRCERLMPDSAFI